MGFEGDRLSGRRATDGKERKRGVKKDGMFVLQSVSKRKHCVYCTFAFTFINSAYSLIQCNFQNEEIIIKETLYILKGKFTKI